MNINIEIFLVAAAVLVYLDVVIFCSLLIKRLKHDSSKRESVENSNMLLHVISGKALRKNKKLDAFDYFSMKQSIQLDKPSEETIESAVDILRLERRYLKGLHSVFAAARIEAAVGLGQVGSKTARLALEKKLLKERSYPVKLYIANALADIGDQESISILTASLINSHRWYRDRVNMLIADFGGAFDSYMPIVSQSESIEIKELIVDFSSVYFSEQTRDYLIRLVNGKAAETERLKSLYGNCNGKCCANCLFAAADISLEYRTCRFNGTVKADYRCRKYKELPVSVHAIGNHERLVYKAAELLASIYPKVLDAPQYLHSEDIELRNIAIKALASFNTIESLRKLVPFMGHEETARSAVHAASLIIERNPGFMNSIVELFIAEKEMKIKQRLAEVLASKIEYFIMKLSGKNGDAAAAIIREILLLGKTSEVIGFLNKNKDLDIENELLAVVKEVIPLSSAIEKELSQYLAVRLANKCGLPIYQENSLKKEEKKDKKLVRSLYIILAVTTLLFPAVYAMRHYDIIFKLPFMQQLKIFIIDFNYYLAFYSIAINGIYIILLLLSHFNVRLQARMWKVKNISLLFKKKILPSISIIAPAYNEEKTIIESLNSLLNLKYPDYELIIVNDGSKDNTLDVLIKYFDLKRVDYIFDYKLNTKPVRGIYLNRSMPKLIVVDKENGGKADSLNAGINISKKEYFCGIDADSLLEPEALLKLASLTLDEGVETPALGGNIFPINGCTIERGHIDRIGIPQNNLARFQTIEYIRAFMAGRLGWAYANSLLIISGAFGLFRKERVISVGGYLTSSGKYAKDTVGEDMELVVRISRLMRELRHSYRICYAFNANCWTEVPEDIGSLKRQRYRWHKGLIDILTFHRKMLFNPAYGRTGMLAMPYFLIFEMIGPLIEVLGYVMVVAAFFMGLLNVEIALLLFISTILMGVLVSVSSLLIAEKDNKYFRLRDILVLTAYSVIENFGPRQLFSLWRVGGYISMLRKPVGWGKMERKGFAASNTAAKG